MFLECLFEVFIYIVRSIEIKMQSIFNNVAPNSIPPPITTNDRTFTCGNSQDGCGINGANNMRSLMSTGLINTDFTLFNTSAIREELDVFTENAKNIVDAYMAWLRTLEEGVELKIKLNIIKPTTALFNQINILVAKSVTGRKNIRAWYSSFLESASDLSDLILKYSEAVAKIESIGVQTTSQSSLPSNMVTIAKQNITKSRSIDRQITKILSIDTRIRNLMQQMSFRMKELVSGIFKIYRSDGSFYTFNINEFAEAIKDLDIDDSPLKRIQNSLSEVINNTPITYKINTLPPTSLNSQPIEPILARLNTDDIDVEYLFRKLEDFQSSVLYTENTRDDLAVIFTQIEKISKDFPQRDRIEKLISDIKLNTPSKVLFELRSRSEQPENIYTLIQRIKNLMDNLKPNDVIYRRELEIIYNKATETAKRLIASELNLTNNQSPNITITSPSGTTTTTVDDMDMDEL